MATRRDKSRRSGSNGMTATPLQRAILREAGRKVTIVSDGKQQEATIGEVVSRKLMQVAANGSPHALSNAVNEIIRAEQLVREEAEREVEFGERLKAYQQLKLEAMVKQGMDTITLLPHPDDIVIIEGVGFRIDGPADAAELEIIITNCRHRDLLLLQCALEDRIGGDDPDDSNPGGSAMLLAQVLNHGLPDRFHLSDAEMLQVIMRHRRKSRRDLLKEARAAWAGSGRPQPRGYRLPPLAETRRKLERLVPETLEVVQQVKAGEMRLERAVSRLREVAVRG